jgi:hypothetical protein
MIFQKLINGIKDFFLMLFGALLMYLDKEEEAYYRICALSILLHPIERWRKHKGHQEYYHIEIRRKDIE